MSSNEPAPPNSEPEDPLEEDWADAGLEPEMPEPRPQQSSEDTGDSGLLPPKRPAASKSSSDDSDSLSPEGKDEQVTRLQPDKSQSDPSGQPQVSALSGVAAPAKRVGRPGKDVMPDLDKLFEQGQVGPESIEDKDWGESKEIGFKWLALLAVGVVSMIIVCLVILHLKDRAGEAAATKNNTEREVPEVVAKLNAALEDLAKRKKEAMDIYAEFASARVVEDILPLIRDSSEHEALIRRTGHQRLVDQDWEPPYQSKWTMHISSGQVFARLEGELPDFSRFRAYFVIDQGNLVMDWKATTAYCTTSYDQLAEGKGDGSEIRGFIRPSNLYTDDFPEKDFDCYQLESPNGAGLIWCYVPEATDEEKILAALFKQGEIVENDVEEKPITLKLERKSDGALKTQWLIDTLHHAEWIDM